MEKLEFIEATKRIEQYYDKSYSAEQLRTMYEILEKMDITRYRTLITQVLKESKYMPKIADFIELDRITPKQAKTFDYDLPYCSKCKNTGYILYMKGNHITQPYAAVCSCGRANKYESKSSRGNFYTKLESEIDETKERRVLG